MRRVTCGGLLLLLLLGTTKGLTQSDTSPDTSSVIDAAWAEGMARTLVSLHLLQLDQWLLRSSRFDPEFVEEVRALRADAADLARQGDLLTAEAFIETCWELIESAAEQDVEVSPSESISNGDGSWVDPNSSAGLEWSRELLVGTDLWRQQFDLAFDLRDSSFVDNSANPYVGLRFNFDSGEWRRGWMGHAVFKYSRDYVSGEADLELRRPLGARGSWSVGNRFEGTRYQPETLQLRYLQNRTRFLADIWPFQRLQLRIEEEFRIRRYADQSETYPSYIENTPRLSTYLTLGSWRIGAGGRFQSRIHRSFPRYDYREWRWDASLYRSGRPGSALFLEFQQRRRDYFNTTFRDSTFLQSYNESFLNGEWRVSLGPAFGVRLGAFGTIRRYDTLSPFTLDFVDVEARPEVVFRLGSSVNLGLGFLWGWRDYGEPAHVSPALSDRPTLKYSVDFEDYRTFGPSITLEILGLDNLVLNLAETYQWRRYPNSTVASVRNFSLYSDRNINSLLLFLSWTVASDFQLSLVANLDDDRGAEADKGSTQSTLLSLELTYGF